MASVAIAIALVADGDWGFRVALAVAAPWLGFAGWRLGDPSPEYERTSPPTWMKPVMIAAVLTLSLWPAKLALGLNLWSPYWDGDQLLMYGMAVFVILTASPRRQAPVC